MDTPGDTASRETAPDTDNVSSIEAPADDAPAAPPPDPPRQPARGKLDGSSGGHLKFDGFSLDAATLVNSPMLPYLAMVASLIEGRAIGCEELLEALLRSLRQRSFDRLPRREYVLRFLKQHPP